MEEILEFAREMEKVITEHNLRYGDSWRTCDVNALRKHLKEEYREWKDSTDDLFEREDCVDIANLCMMIWHRLKPREKL
jgi:hypothetical protein